MRVQICDIVVLIKRILLDIQARRIDVRADNIQALFHLFPADDEQQHGLAHNVTVNLIARLERLARFNRRVEIAIPRRLRLTNGFRGAFALGLARVKESAVTAAYCLQRAQLFFIVSFPCVFAFHVSSVLS